MDELLNEIREKFASTANNAIRPISNLPDTASGFVIRDGMKYGVAVPYEGRQIEEYFSGVCLRSTETVSSGRVIKLLILECGTESVRREFAVFCAEFLNPGDDNSDRHALLADPFKWWRKWCELIGNSVHTKKPYQILGELLTLETLIQSGIQARWQGAAGNTQDIDTDRFACEVKSSLNRYATQITISSKFQLDLHGKPLKLAFVRFEQSEGGDSLEQAVNRLTALGCDKSRLLGLMARQGVTLGNLAYTTSYNLLEMRFYDVNESFPFITDASFVVGHIPENIIQLNYTVDLTGLPYSNSVNS